MAVPEGYTEVGLIGLVNKGNYDPLTEYSKYNFVYYQGSTYLYINEVPQSGVTPSDDGVTWQYMSRGMIMDNTPTQGSPNAVTSGGIYDSERALKTEIQNEQTAATTKATDTNNVLGQGTVTNATNVQALLDNVTDKDTNPTKDSAKTVRSGGVYSADKATREMIAPVEENAVSSAPYAIGEQLVFNGTLCEATSAISIGDTLAIGTNLSVANKITNRDTTPTANSTKLVTSGGVYSADNQIRENIANVEGATSSHPYTVGKQLIFNGLLCKATSAIAVGDTLAVGTNLVLSDNVVEQIYSLNQGLTNSLNEIADMNNVLGAKNLLPNEAVSQTINGVTFTVNSDGSITINGTASADTTLFLLDANQCSLLDDRGKSLVLSGRPTEGVTLNGGSCQLTVGENVNNTWVFHSDNGSGETFTLNSSRLQNNAYIWITSGVTLANAVFKPMLRLASIQDDTYVPYSMTNRVMTPYVQAISNPNLLDNPWFTVNQRGQSSYSGFGYTVDRWKMVYGDFTAQISNGFVTLTKGDSTAGSGFMQLFDIAEITPLLGRTLTLSVMLSDGTIRSNSFEVPSIIPSTDQYYGYFIVAEHLLLDFAILAHGKFGVRFYSTSANLTVSIKAVKLELGSVSTLAMDTAPNYQQELAKCQRYFQRISIGTGQGFGYGVATSTTTARIVIPLSVPLRDAPTISISNADQILINGSSHTISKMEFHAYRIRNNFITVMVTTTGLTNEQVCVLRAGNTVETLEISAEL